MRQRYKKQEEYRERVRHNIEYIYTLSTVHKGNDSRILIQNYSAQISVLRQAFKLVIHNTEIQYRNRRLGKFIRATIQDCDHRALALYYESHRIVSQTDNQVEATTSTMNYLRIVRK